MTFRRILIVTMAIAILPGCKGGGFDSLRRDLWGEDTEPQPRTTGFSTLSPSAVAPGAAPGPSGPAPGEVPIKRSCTGLPVTIAPGTFQPYGDDRPTPSANIQALEQEVCAKGKITYIRMREIAGMPSGWDSYGNAYYRTDDGLYRIVTGDELK